MSKRADKKRARRKKNANHGKRPALRKRRKHNESRAAHARRLVGDRIFDHRKPHPKHRSAVGGFGGDRAVVGLDDRTHDGQAQPDA